MCFARASVCALAHAVATFDHLEFRIPIMWSEIQYCASLQPCQEMSQHHKADWGQKRTGSRRSAKAMLQTLADLQADPEGVEPWRPILGDGHGRTKKLPFSLIRLEYEELWEGTHLEDWIKPRITNPKPLSDTTPSQLVKVQLRFSGLVEVVIFRHS